MFCRGLILAALLIAAGCRKDAGASPDLKVALDTIPNPPRVGTVMVALTLSGSDSRPVSGAKIDLEGDMAHAGMAAVFGNVVEVKPGRYKAQMDLTMAGDWVVLLHIKLAGGQMVEKQVELRGVRTQ